MAGGKATKQNNPMTYLNRLFLHDARRLDLLLPVERPVVTTIITSPPYWKLKDYGVETQIGFGQSKEEYLKDLKIVFTHCLNATVSEGSMWIVVDDYREDGVLKLLPWEVAETAKESGWILRDIIIWDKQHTLPWHVKGQMRNVIEFILFFTKSEDYKFNVDRIKDLEDISRWWIDFPERFNPKGKTPTNIWSIPIRTQGSWRRMSEMNHHCPFPTELVARIIDISTDPGDVVLDPFSGSGVVLAQAAAMGRNFVGCEINRKYIEMFHKSIRREVNAEWEDLRKRREAHRQEGVDFERTIMKLRALKYTRQITKPFIDASKLDSSSKVKAVVCAASIPDRYERKKPFNVDIYVVADAITDKLNQALKIALDRAVRTPLSRYEIHSHIEIQTAEDIIQNPDLLHRYFYLYKEYKPRGHAGRNSIQKWFENDSLSQIADTFKIPMLANISVDLAWALED